MPPECARGKTKSTFSATSRSEKASLRELAIPDHAMARRHPRANSQESRRLTSVPFVLLAVLLLQPHLLAEGRDDEPQGEQRMGDPKGSGAPAGCREETGHRPRRSRSSSPENYKYYLRRCVIDSHIYCHSSHITNCDGQVCGNIASSRNGLRNTPRGSNPLHTALNSRIPG